MDMIHALILSTLVGYFLAARTSLRIWIAVQKTSPSPPIQVENKQKKWRRRDEIALRLVIFLAALGFFLTLFLAPSQVALGFFFAVFGAIYFMGTYSFFPQFLPCQPALSVSRTAQGVPVLISTRLEGAKGKAGRLSLVLLSLGATVAAFATNLPIFVSVVVVARVYRNSRFFPYGTVSMRWVIIGIFTFVPSSIALFGLLAFVVKFLNSIVSEDADSLEEFTWGYADALSQWDMERSWTWPPLFIAYFPALLVALCLRFDYQMHLNSSASPSQPILSPISAPSPEEGEASLRDIVLVPTCAPTGFPKIYFTTSLVASSLAKAIILALHIYIWKFRPHEFGTAASVLELLVMGVALMAMAAIRDEWKALWTYREDWSVSSAPVT